MRLHALAVLLVGVGSVAAGAESTGAVDGDVIAGCTGDCTTLQLKSGSVKGKLSLEGGSHFLGIPFGAPPIGPLRWQPPAPVVAWSGTRQATKWGHACMQTNGSWTEFGGGASEDCLYLNVWLPKGAGDAGAKTYPMMLFFYGGAWVSGSASTPIYGGDAAVGLHRDTIIITANYRLHLFGWLASEALRGTDGATGNFGLQDQRAAMKWCLSNAAAFHGDPERLTVFGESAGAGSITAHLAAPRSRGLFHRAIIESGAAAPWSAMTMSVAETRFDALVRSVGCNASSGAAADAVRCLRGIDANTLERRKPHFEAFVSWSPVIDGVELTEHPEAIVLRGEALDVPVLLGSNRDEGTIFASLGTSAPNAAYTGWVNSLFGVAASAVLRQYPITRFEPSKRKTGSPAFWAQSQVLGDALMTCTARRAARALRSSTPGNRSSNSYRYFLQHEMNVLALAEWVKSSHAYGACHASELALVFDVGSLLQGAGEHGLATQVVTWWQAFAANGSPSLAAGGAPTWPPSTTAANNTMVLDVAHDAPACAVQTAILDVDCDFWDNIDVAWDQLLYGVG